MKRWNANTMLEIGKNRFATILRQKKNANHNHDVHFLAREIDDWLPQGIQTLINGTYDPYCIKRYYFPDEVVDQLSISDRIFQHILLKQLKPTFKYIMNPNCYHLYGPTGVKLATQRIKQALADEKPTFVIRADIKSFYASIPHYKLIQAIRQHYADPKVVAMLENIITNPIDTPKGTINPSNGVALRGPLSQFFSALYLKPLDDAFDQADVTYLRYQDDILILCKSKRQLNRCRRRMMEVLHQRQLTLSRKKTRMGPINSGFHFLGVDYVPTQTEYNTTATPANNEVNEQNSGHVLTIKGGVKALLIINSIGHFAWLPMQGRCEKQECRYNSWLTLGFLPTVSEATCIVLFCGGQIQQKYGITRNLLPGFARLALMWFQQQLPLDCC